MNNNDHNRKMSFEEFRRRRSEQADDNTRQGGDLFEQDWQVFVARFDKNTGKFTSRTFCCDEVASERC